MDLAKTIEWYQKSAEAGDSGASSILQFVMNWERGRLMAAGRDKCI